MPNTSRRSLLSGYRDRIRGLRNGTASYNDDATEQMNRTLFGYEDTLRSHEQWNREAQKRFAEDVENIKRIQGLRANALAFDAQQRTHESGIARANAENEAGIQTARLEMDRQGRLHESGIARELSKTQREDMENRLAMLLAQESLDAFERQREDDAILMRSASFEALDQAIRGGRVSKGTLEKINALRAESEEDYDPAIDDIVQIGMDDDGLLTVDYANGETHPWKNYEALMAYGRLKPQYGDVLSQNLPKGLAERFKLDRAAAIDRENQERQQAYQERNQQRQELSAFVSSVQKSISNIEKQMESVHNEAERAKLDEQRLALYGDLGKAQEVYKKLHPDIFGEQKETGGQGADNPLSRAASETGFYGDATVFDSGSNK